MIPPAVARWPSGLARLLSPRGLSAPQLFAGSFLVLILAGTLGFKVLPGLYTGPSLSWLDALFEWNVALSGFAPVDRLVNGLFLSVTARTAGFNTIDYATATESTNFLTILLMSIGGSPGSTAGGPLHGSPLSRG